MVAATKASMRHFVASFQSQLPNIQLPDNIFMPSQEDQQDEAVDKDNVFLGDP